MCGIFGLVTKESSKINKESFEKIIKQLAILSESRGKDSSGLSFLNGEQYRMEVIKGDIPISKLLKSNQVNKALEQSIRNKKNGNAPSLVFGHARMVTNGSQRKEYNNQPVVKEDIVLVHNGIIVNTEQLWNENPELKKEFDIDTEIINALLRKKRTENPENNIASVQQTVQALEGTFSIAAFFADSMDMVLTTNNGSLYYLTDFQSFFLFGSEKHYLNEIRKNPEFANNSNTVLEQISANESIWIDLMNFQFKKWSVKVETGEKIKLLPKKLDIIISSITNDRNTAETVLDPSVYTNDGENTRLHNLLKFDLENVKKLKRCSKCILPETFPYITFDEVGVCNYCHHHKSSKAASTLDELEKIVAPYRKGNNQPDCIVPFSGGRDSTYSLHIVKKELGLNPIAFTYDWGMVTDLARRNIARVCGKLGVENIIVSADIHWKRKNIRKNVEAWIKKPALGMIPLFMAGDKFFFYYCNKVKQQTGIDLNIWGINDLENTNFKTGFAGIPPKFDKKTIYALSLQNKAKLFGYVGGNMLTNPGYLNGSVLDSLGSFGARYLSPKKDYYHLFDYYQWDEKEVNDLVMNEYNWELAIDTPTTWRIGDGTASFYNYIYYTVAGFSENDTFRSNQIREGMLDRETALELVNMENKPRYETMRWYLEIIGCNFENTIKAINKMPILYPTNK